MSADNTNSYSRASRLRVIADTIAQVPLIYTDPIIIGHHVDAVGPKRQYVRSASGVLMEFEGRQQLACSNHVLDEYEKFLKQDSRAVFQFASEALKPLDRLIARNTRTDIAMIDMSGLEPKREDVIGDASLGLTVGYKTAPQMTPLQPYRTYNWPPSPAEEGDVVFLGGFPEELREVRERGQLISHQSFTIAGFLVTGSFMKPDRFTCRYDPGDWETAFAPADGSRLIIPDFSGLSGCPIFRDASDSTTFTFDLVGFVTGEGRRRYNVLEASASSNIRADGTLW